MTAASPPFPTPEESELRRMINNLMPKSDVFSGKKFLTLLLNRRGVEGVMDFIKKATIALDKGNDLDLAYDFDEVEREAFNASRLEMSRRNFLRTAAWQIGGAVTLVDAALAVGSKAVDILKPDPRKENPNISYPAVPANLLDQAHEATGHYLVPASEALIGAALIYEGHENKIEMKLEQISDAVLQLAEELERKKSQRAP